MSLIGVVSGWRTSDERRIGRGRTVVGRFDSQQGEVGVHGRVSSSTNVPLNSTGLDLIGLKQTAPLEGSIGVWNGIGISDKNSKPSDKNTATSGTRSHSSLPLGTSPYCVGRAS